LHTHEKEPIRLNRCCGTVYSRSRLEAQVSLAHEEDEEEEEVKLDLALGMLSAMGIREALVP
jgi:hypothetical protein